MNKTLTFTAECAYCGKVHSQITIKRGDTYTLHCLGCGKETLFEYGDDLYIKKLPVTGNSVGVNFEKGSKLSKSGEIRDILQDRTLRGSIYSTLRCQTCGEKLKAENSVDNKFLRFYCTNYDCNDNSATILTLEQLVAVLNFNPLV